MAVASTNNTSIAYSLEAVPGTINTTPIFTVLPTTGGSPVSNITTAQSEVIRNDRQTTDLIRVDSDISGDINYEFDFPNYLPLVESLMRADATTGPVSLATATIDTAASTLSLAGIDTALEVGDIFWMSSATNPDNDMARVVTDTSTPGEITYAPPAPAGTTDGSTDVAVDITEIIKNGATCTPDTYTIRKKVTACGAGEYSYYYTGCEINTMNWNLATGSIITGTLGVMGLVEEISSTVPGQVGETDLPVTAYSIMNATSSVGAITIEGVNLGSCSFSSLDLSYDNQVNLAKSIGVDGACATAAFSVMITGSVEVYFNDLSAYNAFLNSTSFAVSIILEDADGNVFGINLPSCKFDTLDTPISGKDAFLMQSGSFIGLMDPTLGYTMKVSSYDAP